MCGYSVQSVSSCLVIIIIIKPFVYFLYCTYLALPFAQPANVIVGLTLLSDQQLHSAMIYGEFSGSNVMFVLWGLCLRLLQVVVMQAHHLDCDVEDVENPWW